MREYVYLAGPMEDVSVEQMTNWRDHATAHLSEHGIKTLDPCRRGLLHDQFDNPNVRARIVQQDLQDISMSRVVFANFQGKGRGLGTMAELSIAQRDRRVIIVLMDHNAFPHPFIHHFATEVHYDMYSALNAITSYWN